MTDVVVDASLLTYALTAVHKTQLLWRRLSRPRVLHAPALIDYEVANAIRGMTLGRKIGKDVAEAALVDFADLPIVRHPGLMTLSRTWELRDNFNGYDASYVGLAEALRVPLYTADGKFRGAHDAEVIVYPADG